jgi:hypothetical protein
MHQHHLHNNNLQTGISWFGEMANLVKGDDGKILEYRHLIANPKTIICQSTLVYFIHITITEGVVVMVAEGYYFTIVVLITKSIVDR